MARADKVKRQKTAQKGLYYRRVKAKADIRREAKHIHRGAALKRLHVTATWFRKLCILQGVFPHPARLVRKTQGTHALQKTHYSGVDIKRLQRSKVLRYLRLKAVFDKRVSKRARLKERAKDIARYQRSTPMLPMHYVIQERYPTFHLALQDMDDALSTAVIFKAIQRVPDVRATLVSGLQRHYAEWQLWVSKTRSLRKVFLSVKGIYYQAEAQNVTITWLEPYELNYERDPKVDWEVMGNFAELYRALLGFVLFKLFTDSDMVYPPTIDVDRWRNGGGLSAFTPRPSENAKGATAKAPAVTRDVERARRETLSSVFSKLSKEQESTATDEPVPETAEDEDQETPKIDVFSKPDDESDSESASGEGDENEKRAAKGKETVVDDSEDLSKAISEQLSHHQHVRSLFSGLVFFLRREVPRSSLDFIISSFGGKALWDMQPGSMVNVREDDARVTHVVADRPLEKGRTFPGRQYIQPQWLYDCINARRLLPLILQNGTGYGLGSRLPAHLSPFVSYEDGDYVPQEAILLNPDARPTVRTGEALEQARIKIDTELDQQDDTIQEYQEELLAEHEGVACSEFRLSMRSKRLQGRKGHYYDPEVDLDVEKPNTKERVEQAKLLRSVMSKKHKRKFRIINQRTRARHAAVNRLIGRKKEIIARQRQFRVEEA